METRGHQDYQDNQEVQWRQKVKTNREFIEKWLNDFKYGDIRGFFGITFISDFVVFHVPEDSSTFFEGHVVQNKLLCLKATYFDFDYFNVRIRNKSMRRHTFFVGLFDANGVQLYNILKIVEDIYMYYEVYNIIKYNII